MNVSWILSIILIDFLGPLYLNKFPDFLMHQVLLFRQHHQLHKFQKRFVLLKLVYYIVLLPFSFCLILLGEWIQEEEDMDKNPVQGTQI
jgi:hypothetical protein